MNAKRILGILLASLILGGCASAPNQNWAIPTDYVPLAKIEIQDRYNATQLTRENFGQSIQACVPQTTKNAIDREINNFPYPRNTSTSFGHFNSANIFLVKGTQGLCIQQSSAQHPIWTAEMLWSTVNPQGVPPDVLQRWYRQIAKEIAEKGIARVAYTFKTGGAHIATYWADQGGKRNATIFYSAEFKKAGEWSPADYPLQFTHPTMSSVSETKRSNSASKMALD